MPNYNPKNLSFNLGGSSPASGITQWAGASDWSNSSSGNLASALNAAAGAGASTATSNSGTGATGTTASSPPNVLQELSAKFNQRKPLTQSDYDRLIAGGFTWADLQAKIPGLGAEPRFVRDWAEEQRTHPYWGQTFLAGPQGPASMGFSARGFIPGYGEYWYDPLSPYRNTLPPGWNLGYGGGGTLGTSA